MFDDKNIYTMENQINCSLCEQQYTDENPPRLLTTCGHTFCETCLSNMMVQKKGSFQIICPEDGQRTTTRDKNMNNFPKNIALLKVIEAKSTNLSFKDSSLEMSKIPNQEYTPEDDDARDLMDVINGKNENEETKKEEEQPQIQMCLLHQKPLEVVCIIDLKKICANCAIFGEHKGHEFKSLQEIQKERYDYYNSILKVMEKKQGISQRISNQETCSQIMGILQNKKNKMKKQINDKYKKLFQTIESKQKESLKSLDGVISKTETKLKNLMKIDPQIMQKYDGWEEKSYKQIKILEGDDFEDKLELLFRDYDAGDILDDGDKIIEQMEKQEQNLIQQVELALENIGINHNQDIYNHTDSFIDVYDQVKKKKSKSRASKAEKVNTSKKQDSVLSKNQQSPKNVIINIPQTKVKIIDYQQSSQILHATNEESLLEMEEQVSENPKVIEVEKVVQKQEEKKETPPPPQNFLSQPVKIQRLDLKSAQKDQQEKMKSPSSQKRSIDLNYAPEKTQRVINKKKLNKIKVPEKYQKVLEGVVHDTLETVDFTNAQLGEANILLISELLKGTKAKTVKFIRNKLEDEVINKILPYMGNVITLNLSQNFLTERTLDILINGKDYMQNMKNIILSQNKIIERKHKTKIEKLRKLDFTVSV